MKLSFQRVTTLLGIASLLAMFSLLTGCQTSNPGSEFQEYQASVWVPPGQTNSSSKITNTRLSSGRSDVFRVGDVVVVTFSGTSEPIQPHEERIKDDGTITLSLVESVQAAGKTPGELQHDLQTEYNKYYNTLVVTVRSFSRYYYVGGEVKRPGALEYLGETSVTKAIQAAGDFTDFARKTSIRVIRADGTSLTVNFKKLIDDAKLDPPIYPGDTIHVPRRHIW